MLTEHAKRAEEIIGESEENSIQQGSFTLLIYHGVDYGALNGLDKLQDAGIAYDSSWDASPECMKGCRSLRFTPEGEAVEKEIYDAEMDAPLKLLLDAIEDHQKLKQRIRAHEEGITVLPWDNQAHYGKLYMARQIVAPKKG